MREYDYAVKSEPFRLAKIHSVEVLTIRSYIQPQKLRSVVADTRTISLLTFGTQDHNVLTMTAIKLPLLIGLGIGAALTLAFVYIRRLQRGRAMGEGFSITFGDPAEQKRFAQEFRAFLIEWRELQEVVKHVMLGRTILPPDQAQFEGLADDDPKVIAAEDRYKADLSSWVLARTAVDDFSEILILSCNGYGIGALKTLRGMYERVVTSTYVALFPDVSRALIDNVWTHKWKLYRRAMTTNPKGMPAIEPDKVEELKQKAAEAQARLNESICNECLQLKQIHAWTKVDLSTMASKVDKKLKDNGVENFSLSNYYLRCYLQPTALEHATGMSINEKFAFVDGNWTYKMNSTQERRQALLFGHALLIMLLGLQNDHFGYGLDEEINERSRAYRRVWASGLPEEDAKALPE
jgi:hypothetical protein